VVVEAVVGEEVVEVPEEQVQEEEE